MTSQTILIVAPHPDDDVLGCGGTIRKYVQQGTVVNLCIVTKAYEPQWSAEFIANRPKQVRKAADILGVKEVFFLDLPTVRLDTLPQQELNAKIAEVVEQTNPDTLFIPHRGDINTDHRLVHEAALVAARPLPGTKVKNVLAYETLSETEWGLEPFVPNVYEDVTDTLEVKMEAMQVYEEELRTFPHPRSLEAIEALAKKRGSEVGILRAEAFMLIRAVQ